MASALMVSWYMQTIMAMDRILLRLPTSVASTMCWMCCRAYWAADSMGNRFVWAASGPAASGSESAMPLV